MTTQLTPTNIINIPRIDNDELFEKNEEKASMEGFEHCPCCGKAIKNPKFFFKSIYGSCAYPSSGPSVELVNDAWVMGVGSECQKRFPKGYIFQITQKGA
jgi:hypothetical protein